MTVELKPGDEAPNFTLPTEDGEVSLGGLRGRAVVLYFYPKDDTSGCTSEAQQFSEHLDAFTKAGAFVVGVSRDDLKSHAKFRKKYDLKVALGSDEDGAVTEAYGVWVEKSMYGRQYMGIERATFLIGADGRILQVWRKVKTAGHAAAVLEALRAA
jgi:thioredoxin-dependent peroxiredoxin